jgi:hypothetical protein
VTVPVYDYGIDAEGPYYTMELLARTIELTVPWFLRECFRALW